VELWSTVVVWPDPPQPASATSATSATRLIAAARA
jgi:hypothetical protein